ncbi:GNAT family N-acetyltransferase [Actinoplanes sp. NPDC049596]|uniref:GNAT family N-acetyltransferase n=1 Tax=unclassified Actinoplanes TaxID=2626549 RepID=UPI00341B6C6E
MEIRRLSPADVPGVMRLCEAEGWPSFTADAARTLRILTAPGVTTMVAVDDDGSVAGFAEMFSDGELQAYLALLAVDAAHRGAGIGRRLVTEALREAGGERIDTLSEDDAAGFYRSFPHFVKPGFRIYPFHQG